MWCRLLVVFLFVTTAAHAGDYGRKSLTENHQAKQDQEFKIIKSFTKDLPKEIKTAVMKTYFDQKIKTSQTEDEHPGADMQSYVERFKLVQEVMKDSVLDPLEQKSLQATLEGAKLFTSKSNEAMVVILKQVLDDKTVMDNDQRNLLLKTRLVSD